MTRIKLGPDVPVFKIRWRGYDRIEVEEYLRESRLQKCVARLDVSAGGGQPSEELGATRQRLVSAEAELETLRAEAEAAGRARSEAAQLKAELAQLRKERAEAAGRARSEVDEFEAELAQLRKEREEEIAAPQRT